MPDKIVNHFVLADGSIARYDYNGLLNAPSDEFAEIRSNLTSYETLNDNRFIFSENLFDSDSAILNYYVSNTNGNLVAYNGWFATPYMSVNGGSTYSWIVKPSSSTWQRQSGVYYAFYDGDKVFTHGGVTTTSDITSQSGDAFFRGSYYHGSEDVTMFGTSSDMDGYIGTRDYKLNYYVAPKYEKDPYKGLGDVFFYVSNPYYSMCVQGDRIHGTQNGHKYGAFVKFDTITAVGQDGFKTKTWAEFKNDVQNDPYYSVMTAYDGTPDTLQVYKDYGIVYDYVNNEYHMKAKVYITNLTKHNALIFYDDGNSEPSGVLYEAWESHKVSGIQKYIRTIEQKETELLNYGNNFVFAFATDCHWYFDDTNYHNYTNEMIEELRKCIGFDCYINGGDSIYYGTDYKLNGVASLNKAFEPQHDNYIYCIGNHDYNGVSGVSPQTLEWMFDETGIESLCMRKLVNINRPDGKRYYYRDFDDKKTRVIVLDTSDIDLTFNADGELTSDDPLAKFVVRQAQIDWLCTALDCQDSDWSVIIVMHVGLYLPADGFIDNNTLTNKDAIIEVLKAYVNKTTYSYSTTGSYAVSGSGSFANANGHLVGVWSGHAHADGYCNKDGFNAIQTECGYPDSVDRVAGTIDELCVDCVCVNMDEKTVTLKRFGAGSDRAYTFV